MPTKSIPNLPEPLRHLQPFIRYLSNLPQDEINEDSDSSLLDAALRRRVRGMDEPTADAILTDDRRLLADWLQFAGPDAGAGAWVLGYLLLPELAGHLIHPPEPPPKGPKMTMEAPAGCKLKAVPFRLDVKQGKMIGSIIAIDEPSFQHMLLQWEQATPVYPPHIQGSHVVSEVRFGQSVGRKYCYQQTAPLPWKQVSYHLCVLGGYVSISLGTTTGADFDERPLEGKLHTLRLSELA